MDKEKMLNDLAELIAIPSYTEDRTQTRKALDWVLEKARGFGCKTGMTEEGDAGYAELGSGDVTLGILVHVDVVGIGDADKWNSPPYSLTIRGGVMYGRGVEDDKGPVIQSLYAMKALKDSGVPLKKRIRLIVGTSEERVWTDMDHYKQQFGVPDYGFSPDSEFPVYNIEKGYADMHLFFDGAGLERLESGDSPNTVPSRAVMRRAGGEDELFHGVSVHSSAPEMGDNAILKLARSADGFDFARFICDMFDGDTNGIRLGLDDGTNMVDGIFVDKTVCSPTILRLENGRVFVNVNIRSRVGMSIERIISAFEQHSHEYGYECRLNEGTEPMYVDPNSSFICEMNRVAQEFGFPTGCMVAAGASYCGTMPNHVGWGPVIPPDEGCAHQENEYYSIEDFMRTAHLYAEYLIKVAQTEE